MSCMMSINTLWIILIFPPRQDKRIQPVRNAAAATSFPSHVRLATIEKPALFAARSHSSR